MLQGREAEAGGAARGGGKGGAGWRAHGAQTGAKPSAAAAVGDRKGARTRAGWAEGGGSGAAARVAGVCGELGGAWRGEYWGFGGT